MRELFRRIWYLLRRRRMDADLAEELAFHRAMKTHDLEAEGAEPREAALDARRALGSTALAHDHAHDVWVPRWLQGTGRDFRFAARLLRKDRWFTLTVAVTLAIGIGGSGTIFALNEGMFLRGLPVPQPDRIVSVQLDDAQSRPVSFSKPQFDDWSETAKSVAGLAAYTGSGVIIADRDRAPERVAGAYISWNAFSVLQVQPILGRDFSAADDQPGAAPAVILSDALWKSRYGRDPAIIGQTMLVNGNTATIIGVMPSGFAFPIIEKVWEPLAKAPAVKPNQRDARNLQAFGRLRANATIAQAEAELNTIASRLARAYPDTDADLRTTVRPYTGGLTGLGNPWMLGLAAVTLLLLIACANVAGLLLTRAVGRSHDLAIRASLGASTWRLVRPLLVESLLLGATASALGFILTGAGIQLWVASLPVSNWPFWYRWSLDGRVAGFLVAVGLTVTVLCGLAPVLRLRASAHRLLQRGNRTGGTDRETRRWTAAFLIGELALTLVLLAGGGLLTRSMFEVLRSDALVDSAHILLGDVGLPLARYRTPAQRTAFVEDLQARMAAQSEVRSFAVANALPFYDAPLRALDVAGQAFANLAQPPHTTYVVVGGHYFETLGVHLLRGRTFNAIDGTKGHEAAIVNRRFAALYLSGKDPLGQRIRAMDPNTPHADAPWLTIVGLSPDIRQHYAQDQDAVIYVPFRQDPQPFAALLARTNGDPEALVPAVRASVHAIDPTLPVFNVTPLDGFLDEMHFVNRVFLTIFGSFAVFALLLSALGLYASTAYSVKRRTREVGVRLALGAQRRQVAWLFLKGMLHVAAVGGVIGLVCALGVTRIMRRVLVGTSPTDPVTLFGILAILALVVVAATLLGARRAARLEPTVALRHE